MNITIDATKRAKRPAYVVREAVLALTRTATTMAAASHRHKPRPLPALTTV